MAEEDQGKPLAPLSLTTRSDQPTDEYYHLKQTQHFHSRNKLILCCGLITSLILLIAVTFLVLALTVFHLHNPLLTVDSVSLIQQLDFVNGKVKNTTVSEMISLRNPNAAPFRVRDITISFYCGESVVVGESSRTSETIPAKHTVKMNLTAEIDITKLQACVAAEDFKWKGVDLQSNVSISGRMKIMRIFKKSLHLTTNCSMKMMTNTSNVTFQDMRCSRHVKI